MPSSVTRRQILRTTWLQPSLYSASNITMHPIFLLGTEYDAFGNIKHLPDSREDNCTDILQTDMKESHYALVHKDYTLLQYVREQCPHVDFVFKGKVP